MQSGTVTSLVTITKDVTELYLCPVLNFLASDLAVANDNHWSVFYLVNMPYHDGFMLLTVFEKPARLDK